MHKLTEFLASGPLPGSDTSNLGFRVGLHSGSVTAGVLRGDKGRFQLFGDTMNNASRMESTGLKNNIQVSRETANLLIAAGYQKWLTPREDIVHVKGKGNVRTFLVKINPGSSATYRSSTTGLDSHSCCSTDESASDSGSVAPEEQYEEGGYGFSLGEYEQEVFV
jgi:hypothetical protein